MRLGWLTAAARRWLALVGGVITLTTVALFATTNFRLWAWLAIAFLFSWVVVFAMSARSEHNARLVAESATREDPRGKLRSLLTAASLRYDDLSAFDSTKNPSWSLNRWTELHDGTYKTIDRFLPPPYAEEFSAAGGSDVPNHPGFQMRVRGQAAYLHELLGKLDSIPIMGDWGQR